MHWLQSPVDNFTAALTLVLCASPQRGSHTPREWAGPDEAVEAGIEPCGDQLQSTARSTLNPNFIHRKQLFHVESFEACLRLCCSTWKPTQEQVGLGSCLSDLVQTLVCVLMLSSFYSDNEPIQDPTQSDPGSPGPSDLVLPVHTSTLSRVAAEWRGVCWPRGGTRRARVCASLHVWQGDAIKTSESA